MTPTPKLGEANPVMQKTLLLLSSPSELSTHLSAVQGTK